MKKSCRDVMTRDPACSVPEDSASRAAKIMKTEDVGSIPVCQDRTSRRLIGIVTDRDLVINVVAEGRDSTTTRLQDVMTRQPFTCHPEDDLQTAVEAMEKHQVRRIPIIDSEGKLVGIIAQADIATRSEQPETTAEVVEKISHPVMV
jgi:CBS domain-containing protein